MRFTLDTPGSLSITGYSSEGITVGGRLFRSSVLILPDGVSDWDCSGVEELDAGRLAPVLAAEPAIVLLGSGRRLAFPDPDIVRWLGREGIGLEVMDTRAACRTFNILLQEGRPAVAALIVDPPAG